MKIAGKTVKGFVVKTLASKAAYYGWEPNPLQRRAGWKTMKLDARDLGHAIQLCEEQNARVAGWRDDGATPAGVKAFTRSDSFNALLDRYERDKMPQLAASTRHQTAVVIRKLRLWAGKHETRWITRQRVLALRDALMKEAVIDGPGHATTFNLLATLRRIFSWAVANEIVTTNPAADFGLSMPAPRNQVWEDEDFAAFTAAATAEQLPEIALAVDLGLWIGQREGDVIGLTTRHWQEFIPDDGAHTAALAGPDGKVMGFRLRQSKTGRWVGIPVPPDLRARVEAAFAANAARTPAVTTLLVCEGTGRPWTQRNFIRAFDQVRRRAVADGHAALATLQFRDLRRTRVVRMGRLNLNDAQISAITGHRLETTKRILETYMPRDEHMATSAAVAMLPPRKREADKQERSA